MSEQKKARTRDDAEIWDLWCQMPRHRDMGRRKVIALYRAGIEEAQAQAHDDLVKLDEAISAVLMRFTHARHFGFGSSVQDLLAYVRSHTGKVDRMMDEIKHLSQKKTRLERLIGKIKALCEGGPGGLGLSVLILDLILREEGEQG